MGPFATEPAFSQYATMPVLQDVIGNTDSIEALQWINTMITRCDAEHNNCTRLPDTRPPKRVIGVGEPYEGQIEVPGEDDIRLVETNNAYADYVCLSQLLGNGFNVQNYKRKPCQAYAAYQIRDLPRRSKTWWELRVH